MKKLFTRSLFAFVIMGFALVNVNAAVTEYGFADWKAPDGYGEKTEVTDYITNIMGEEVAVGGMYLGPYSKKATEVLLADGVKEEVHVDLDFNGFEAGEFFEVTLSFDDEDESYLDEAVVMTQLVEEGKFKLTAGWAPEFEAVVTEDGVYTYRWEAYVEGEKTYVKFSLVNDGEVVETTGAIEFAKLNVEGVTVRSLWFCNVNVAEGVNVYSRLPELTVSADTESEVITIVDEEAAEEIIRESAKVDYLTRYFVERFDTFVSPLVEIKSYDEMLENDEETVEFFDEELDKDTIINFFRLGLYAEEDEYQYSDTLIAYTDEIDYNLVLPTDLPEVAKNHERKFYLIKADMADYYEKIMELLEEDPDALDNMDEYELLELEVVEPTLSKDGKTLTFASDSYDLYALSYIDSELPPKTGDNVVTYVIMGIVSMIALAVVGKKSKKLFN